VEEPPGLHERRSRDLPEGCGVRRRENADHPEQYIGTGPYKFAERNPGRYIKLVRNEEYSARTEAADGYAGKREALFDEIRFIPVPDVGTRVNGVKAGDYDYAEQILGDLFDSLKEDPSVVTTVNQGANQGMMFFT
jgi:peptide/nickel transport system substrate-binding protein